MKTALAVLFLALSVSAHAAHPWIQFEGCYTSLERNGEPVESYKYYNVSKMSYGNAWFVTDTEGKKIPALNFMVYQKHSEAEQTVYYDYQAAFESLGNYSIDADGHHFVYEGTLKLYDGTVFSLSSSITLREMSESKLLLKVKRTVTTTDGTYDSNDEYLLEKKNCD